jgi:hypothetical protein
LESGELGMERVLLDKSARPRDSSIREALLDKYPLYETLMKRSRHLKKEWVFYTKKSGWILKLLKEKRTAFYVIIFDAAFQIGMAFNMKEKETVLNAELPDYTKNELAEARKFPEGYPLRITVVNETDLEIVMTVLKAVRRIL